MGYYVTLEEANFVIPADNLPEADRRLRALNHSGAQKNGGSFSGGAKSESWFSWMDPNYDDPAVCPDVKSIFEMLGFYCSITEGGGLSLDGYDNKTGQEELFLAQVNDLVPPDSFMRWSGEDGGGWIDEYGGPAITHKSGRMVFE